MQSGFEDTETLAEVVPLAPVRETREADRGLAADCPGWRCWYSLRTDLWFGKRIVERWVPEMTARASIVIAADPAMLQVVITRQAVLDLAIEFADWEIEWTPGGHWWATWRGAADGRTRPIFCEVSPTKLAVPLRDYVAGLDEPQDRRLVWLCSGDDE
jgi:hypothetical protein